MPPEFRSLSREDAVEFLEAHGLVAIKPPVRSSDFRLCTDSPFHYLLCRRMGLVPSLRWSEALNRGTWFHERFALMHLPEAEADAHYKFLLGERLDELMATCQSHGIDGEKRRAILATEEQDHATSLAWYKACSTIEISKEYGTITQFLQSPHYRVICAECLLGASIMDPMRATDNPTPCVAQPDLLLYHTVQNSLWVVDYKTTSLPVADRAASCSIEPQTQHYLHVLEIQLKNAKFREQYNLPDDVRVGGMMHVIIQKPTIEFGMKDRDYTMDTTPLKSGPRKGMPRNEKVYQGEPRLENYIQRCLEWYHGEGEYAHLSPERVLNPPVNISFTSADALLDSMWRSQYLARLRSVNRWRALKPDPGLFPWPVSVSGKTGRRDPYADFVLRPITEWPEIVKQNGFAIVRRDLETLEEEQESTDG
jgi:hypothetical protein